MTAKVEISKRLVLVNSTSAAATRIIDISVPVWLCQFLLLMARCIPFGFSLRAQDRHDLCAVLVHLRSRLNPARMSKKTLSETRR